MKIKAAIIILILITSLKACKKDDSPVPVHLYHTRIEYNINSPQNMPNVVFEFNNPYDLTGNASCYITMIADDQAPSLNLTIMLEDNEGNQTDVMPFKITDLQIYKDDKSHTYIYNFENKLNSSTSASGIINIREVKKVRIYINAGGSEVASRGYFWFDRIQFDSLK